MWSLGKEVRGGGGGSGLSSSWWMEFWNGMVVAELGSVCFVGIPFCVCFYGVCYHVSRTLYQAWHDSGPSVRG